MSVRTGLSRPGSNVAAIAREVQRAAAGVRLPGLIAHGLAELVDAVDLSYVDVGLRRLDDARADVEILVLTPRLIVHTCLLRVALDGSAHTVAPDTRVWPVTRVSSVSIGRGQSPVASRVRTATGHSATGSGPAVRSVITHLDDGTRIRFPLAEHNRVDAAAALRMLLAAI